jgi:hypothetical protein
MGSFEWEETTERRRFRLLAEDRMNGGTVCYRLGLTNDSFGGSKEPPVFLGVF